jgi:histidinol-phosphate aminotransferase
MTTAIRPQPGIMGIDLYQGGASHVDGLDNVIKLS